MVINPHFFVMLTFKSVVIEIEILLIVIILSNGI